MPVIINELDVVIEPESGAPSPTTEPLTAAGGAPTAQDLDQVHRFLAERRERVRAD